MHLSERINSIEAIAALLGKGVASHAWTSVGKTLVLKVTSGKKSWGISANLEPVGAGEDMCTAYLLRKMAHAAAVCHRCLKNVPRTNSDPKTNKTHRKRYRCPECLYSWTDS